MAVVLLDSVVVASFLDRDDAFHRAARARVRQLIERDRLITSVVTYAEVLVGAALGHHDAGTVRAFFAERVGCVVPVDKGVAERAAVLRSVRRRLELPDALILATAEGQGAELVLGGDSVWRRIPGYGCKVELLQRE